MEKAKAIWLIIVGMLGAFVLGGYTFGTIYEVRDVEPFQWFITTFFMLFFMINGVSRYKKL